MTSVTVVDIQPLFFLFEHMAQQVRRIILRTLV